MHWDIAELVTATGKSADAETAETANSVICVLLSSDESVKESNSEFDKCGRPRPIHLSQLQIRSMTGESGWPSTIENGELSNQTKGKLKLAIAEIEAHGGGDE